MKDQLGLDDESNAKIADRYTMGSSARHRVAVGDLPASSVSAPQLVLETLCSARTPPLRSAKAQHKSQRLRRETRSPSQRRARLRRRLTKHACCSQQVQALRAQRADEKARLEARLNQLQDDDDDDDEYGVDELINSAPGYSDVQQNAVAFAGADRSDRPPPLGPDCLHDFYRSMPRRSDECGHRRPQMAS